MNGWLKAAGWCCLVVCGLSVYAAEEDFDAAAGDWANEAEVVFRQVKVLHSTAAELKAAGIEDLARAATDRATHLEQHFVSQLREVQQHVVRTSRAPHRVGRNSAGVEDRLILRCQLIEFQPDLNQQLAKSYPPRFDILSDENLRECRQELKRLLELGQAKVIAQPTLLTVNGQSAQFQSGGAFPVPIPTQSPDSSEHVEFREFGVMLEATPHRQPDGRWRIALRLDVSECDQKTAVTLAGIKVPGLTKRAAETITTLATGQTLAVTGFKYEDKDLVLLVTAENLPTDLPTPTVLPAPPLPNPPAP